MKMIYKIARTELRTLFYSPIAWLILIIFTFQTGMFFAGTIEGLARNEFLGYGNRMLTMEVFGGYYGLFLTVQQYLYLYIPLLTMGLMSREFGSGSIKLLYSSPVTNTQIVLGKYLAMLIYGLVLMFVLVIYSICGCIVIENVDVGVILTGLLGVYLLLCAYAAIGLFMSSLTSYQIVAAVGTLGVLACLTYVSRLWQSIEFVRDLTYWLGLTGRIQGFLSALISSEDVLYFVIVIVLFLVMTIIRMLSRRRKVVAIVTVGRYLGVWGVALLLGYLSSCPVLKKYWDMSEDESNTLTKGSREIVEAMNGGLTITTYVNMFDSYYRYMLPHSINHDLRRMEKYTRFKPEIKMKYVYYYANPDTASLKKRFPGATVEECVEKICEIEKMNPRKVLSPEEIKKQIDLSGENYRLVRLVERENGQKIFLRVFEDNMLFPTEAEISAAFKRLIMPLPKVGFLVGHGERDMTRMREMDYSVFSRNLYFRYALINQGFDCDTVSLKHEIPADVNILCIADMRVALSEEENANLHRYIERGGNLIICGETGRQEIMNPVVENFGVRFMPGRLVRPSENRLADLILASPTKESVKMSYHLGKMLRYREKLVMPGTVALEQVADKGFKVTTWFVSDTIGGWNELEQTDFTDMDVPVILNVQQGETEKAYPTVLALSRQHGDREQKIIIFGDADCISNGELSRNRSNMGGSNYTIIQGAFFWLSDGEVPIDMRRPVPTDNKLKVSRQGVTFINILFLGGLPGILLLWYLFIWLRRRGR
ncbi:ABC transporter [Odoribacter sp. AF15-53]|mgnify:CR=1 FL=1|nr:Gldg family protein [Odoribacter sp. AF15-53]RHR78387.1 ABC transporter [Odoribacter sp. AF15-53]